MVAGLVCDGWFGAGVCSINCEVEQPKGFDPPSCHIFQQERQQNWPWGIGTGNGGVMNLPLPQGYPHRGGSVWHNLAPVPVLRILIPQGRFCPPRDIVAEEKNCNPGGRLFPFSCVQSPLATSSLGISSICTEKCSPLLETVVKFTDSHWNTYQR